MTWTVLPAMAVGVLIWAVVFRPMQLREHERRRRKYGLEPKRKLPEDKR